MPYTHRVRRAWRDHPAGTFVDASTFRNGPALIRAGYIEPLSPVEAETAGKEPSMTIPNTPPSERRSHVVPMPDEPRVPLTPPEPEPHTPAVEAPPPEDQRPAMPPLGPPPPKDQAPAKQDPKKEPGPPKGQEPARTPPDGPLSRDEAEELRRHGGKKPVAPQHNNPPVLDPERSTVQDKLGSDKPAHPSLPVRRRLPE